MKNSLIFLFFACAGIVLGALVSSLTAGIKALSWLGFGLSFGLTEPLVLNLSVIKITLGATFNLNIAVIIFVSLAIFIAYRVTTSRSRRR